MPYYFPLPTTSSVLFQQCIECSTHPSLPFAATTQRSVLRTALKKHKRLSPSAQVANLSSLLSALNGYIPYLFALDTALSNRAIEGEEIDVALQKEIESEWRSSVAATLPGREAARTRGRGLDYEVICVLSTFGYIQTLQARSQIHMLYSATQPTPEQRASIISAATKHLLETSSVHTYLTKKCDEESISNELPEVSSSVQGALAKLALAEATLLAVLKDDPWPGVVAQERNKADKEWMVKPPEIPKVRTHLFARLCLAAAEHAGTAESMLQSVTTGRKGQVDAALVRYVSDLKRTSRAKACRFFGIDSDMGGETGKGLAWLHAGEEELGFVKSQAEGSKIQSLARLKKDWTEKREDKKMQKGGDWGSDAGRLEEARIIEVLKKKWNKMNDTINTQVVPPSGPLIASMPTGRDIHSTKPFLLRTLDADTLAQMRAPPDKHDDCSDGSDTNSDEDSESAKQTSLPGAFPTASVATPTDSYY